MHTEGLYDSVDADIARGEARRAQREVAELRQEVETLRSQLAAVYVWTNDVARQINGLADFVGYPGA